MKCHKCYHENNEYSVICEKCGVPLDIESNEKLMAKYRQKGTHIDIEEIEKPISSKDTFNSTKSKVFKVLLGFFICIFIAIVSFLAYFWNHNSSNELVLQYDQYMKNSSLVVFYLGTEENKILELTTYADMYGFDFLNIDAGKISEKNKRRIRKELNIYNLESSIVIVRSGVPVDSTSANIDSSELRKYLQDNKLVPEMLGDAQDELTNLKAALSSKGNAILYIPTKYNDNVLLSSEKLNDICKEYGIKFYEVDGFYLSHKQLLNVMSQVGFSEIQDDLIIYLFDGEIKKTIIDKDKNKDTYFNLLTSYGIIDETSTNSLIYINYKEFNNLITTSQKKQVVLVGNDSCQYCEKVKPMLGEIALKYNINIYYLDAKDNSSEILTRINELGFDGNYSMTPFLLVIEKEKVIDSIVGQSTKELYVERLKEFGVIN